MTRSNIKDQISNRQRKNIQAKNRHSSRGPQSEGKLKTENRKLKAPAADRGKRASTIHDLPSTIQKDEDQKSTKESIKSKPSDKKVTLKPASSMDELMARRGSEIKPPRKGDTVVGTVTDVSGRTVLLDIGAKAEGLITDRDFEESRDFIKSLSVGDRVSVYIVSPENDRGQILLSLRNAAQQWQWKKLIEWKEEGKTIEVRGLDVNKGGVVARIDSMDIQGFVPTSHLSAALAKNLDGLINRVFSVKIIEVDRQNNRLIFSEKFVSEAGEIEAKKSTLSGLTVGTNVKGMIVGITDFGAFARVHINSPRGEAGDQDVEGLIHISELAWDKVEKADDVVKVGDEVDLVIIDVHPETGKIGFSLKQRLSDPWDGIESRYPPGKKMKGKVTKIASFGAFVQLEPGVSGLLHISKIPTGNEPVVGQEVEVTIEDLDSEHRRLALGMAGGEAPAIYR